MALTVTRRANEALLIGDNITVTVSQVSGGKVRLTVDAPKDVKIHRDELRLPFYRRKAFLRRIVRSLKRRL
ncbi:carbon storage regulator [Marinobacterium sedimentorum]|uniref:carbon storage regulator n=1 Tax=Marinobacterium sedimentorum TaxID=2927804 RepID=UPI0020C6BBD7|nr:carbon storage regulator [Marinobacterium sedimentorum]MCP8685955.1 carbon storage regulator [Marinobacterium sedimentorum]